MKRTALIVLAVGALATAGVFAQTVTKPAAQKPAPTAVGPSFVDANGDGVCDNFTAGTGRQGRGFGRGMGAGMGRRMGGGFGAGVAFGRNGESLIDVTARATGLTTDDVLAALRGGRTFAQIAEAHGKSAQDLVQSALASRRALLAAAVGGGRLTQEQADQIMVQMKLRLEQCVTSPWEARGRGRGFQGQCPFAGTAPAAPAKK